MEIRLYVKVLLRRWWLVIAPVLVVAIYVLATYVSPPPTYQVVMRFAAGTRPAGLSADYDRYYPWLTSEYVANGLADIARTGAFAQAVAARLAASGLDVSPGDIQAHIASDNAQSIFVIYFTWSDPAQIVPIAQAIAAELTTNGVAYFPQLEGIEPAARLMDAPTPVALAPGLRTQLMGPAVKLALAFVAGAALAFLWHYLDPTVREAAEVEAMGVQVLAEIPKK
jgi:capsular polysaccharide biosynthesis protein